MNDEAFLCPPPPNAVDTTVVSWLRRLTFHLVNGLVELVLAGGRPGSPPGQD